jgi:hypothetical protein
VGLIEVTLCLDLTVLRCTGRGTLERINSKTLQFEARNRSTVSSATVLALVPRNNGIIAAGGAGTLRFYDGIHTSVREVDHDSVITKIEADSANAGGYHNNPDRLIVSCGPAGILSVGFGAEKISDSGSRESDASSSFPAEYFTHSPFSQRTWVYSA